MHLIHYKKPLFLGKGNTSSISGLNNSLEAKINGVHFTCPLGLTALTPQDFDRKRAVLSFCSSFPCHFALSCFLNFSSWIWVLLWAFLTEFLIQDPLSHSVLLCEWHVLFQFTDGEDLVAICYFMLWDLCFFGALLWYALFLWKKWLLRASWPFFLIHGMGSFIYDKLSHSISNPAGLVLSPLWVFKMWSGWSL